MTIASDQQGWSVQRSKSSIGRLMPRTAVRSVGRLPSWARSIWRARQRRDDMPRMLTYTVTFGCNARCIMCDSWKLPTKDDLKLTEVSDIFDQLPPMDVVRLTGGEPFVRADFPRIADLAMQKLRPLVLHITTNGFLTKRVVDFCRERDRSVRLELLVSIDGEGEKHNEIRGHSRAYDLALETVRTIAIERRDLNLGVAVNQTVVDQEGVDHYRRLKRVLREIDVPHHLVIAYDTSATYNLEREIDVAPQFSGEFATFGQVDDAAMTELLTEAYADAADLPLMERLAKRYYLRGIRNRLLHQRSEPNPPCAALTQHLRLFPNGDVPTCQFNSQIVGNLRDQSFADVWQSVRAAEGRRWVRACAGCWAECEVVPSAVYSLDLLRPVRKPVIPKVA